MGYSTWTSNLITIAADPTSAAPPTTALLDALAAAKPGDTIALPGAQYDLGTSFKGHAFAAPGVTITSADPRNPAVFSRTYMFGCSGLTFRGVRFDGSIGYDATKPNCGLDAGGAFRVYGSSYMVFDGCLFHAGEDTYATAQTQGIVLNGGSNNAVTGCEFKWLANAIDHENQTNCTISGNYIHDCRTDAIHGGGFHNVAITSNFVTNMHAVAGDHPDMCQVWQLATTDQNASGLTVSDNIGFRAAGTAFQGPFVKPDKGWPFANVNVNDNLVIGAMGNGVDVYSVHGGSVSGNVVVSLPDIPSFVNVWGSAGVTVENNTAQKVQVVNSTNVTSGMCVAGPVTNYSLPGTGGNVANVAATDGGLGALRAWLQALPLDKARALHPAAFDAAGLPQP